MMKLDRNALLKVNTEDEIGHLKGQINILYTRTISFFIIYLPFRLNILSSFSQFYIYSWDIQHKHRFYRFHN